MGLKRAVSVLDVVVAAGSVLKMKEGGKELCSDYLRCRL